MRLPPTSLNKRYPDSPCWIQSGPSPPSKEPSPMSNSNLASAEKIWSRLGSSLTRLPAAGDCARTEKQRIAIAKGRHSASRKSLLIFFPFLGGMVYQESSHQKQIVAAGSASPYFHIAGMFAIAVNQMPFSLHEYKCLKQQERESMICESFCHLRPRNPFCEYSANSQMKEKPS